MIKSQLSEILFAGLKVSHNKSLWLCVIPHNINVIHTNIGNNMPVLGDNINIWNTCLRILRKNGFKLWIEAEDQSTDISDCFWCAEKNGYDFWASNPIELLGLVAVCEHKAPNGPPNPYWWKVEGDDIYDELIQKRWPE